MSEFTAEPGWLQRQLEENSKAISLWPDSMKRLAGIDPVAMPHPLQVELDRTKAELALGRSVAQDLGQRLETAEQERDRLRGALAEVHRFAARTLAEPTQQVNGDTAALVVICELSSPPEPAQPEAARNWDEDRSHENGNYQCMCTTCRLPFTGHKRRVTCKVCAKPEATKCNHAGVMGPEDCVHCSTGGRAQ